MSSAPVIQQPSKRRLQFFRTVLSFFQMQAVECCTASAAGRTAQHGILQNKLASLLLKKNSRTIARQKKRKKKK